MFLDFDVSADDDMFEYKLFDQRDVNSFLKCLI